ncbi:hypothetical protein MKY91_02120 [Alkalicoccobacillus gibsonii]|uniref:Uncharacterized protein n=1 Tax=Alkalicoccobacillus gibsonii TaxID=79881 RepID=A0ABU9VDI8_9BACI
MDRIIRQALVATLVVASITGLFSFIIRGYLEWMDVINSAIGTFIIWAIFFPLVNKYWGRGETEG